MTRSHLFRGFRTSPEIIRLAVMLYVRFPLSLRNVEDLLHERGIDVSHETVRFWWHSFGPLSASEIRLRGPTVAPHYLTETGIAPLPRDAAGYYRTGDAAALHRRADGLKVLVFDGRLAEDFKLSNGVKVRTGPLRAGLLAACAPLLKEVVVAGENADGLVAVVFPAPDLGEKAGARIGAALAHWNRDNPGRTTAITRFALAVAPPDRELGELSDKGQVVRARYLRNHAAVFADLQAGGGHAPA